MNEEATQRLLKEAVAAARRDPEFGRALRRALDDALPKRQTRRSPAVIDVFATYQVGGESALRNALAPLDVEQLKDVIAQHQMDRSRLAMKWRTTERLVEHIVGHTVSRAHKGEAFSA